MSGVVEGFRYKDGTYMEQVEAIVGDTCHCKVWRTEK